MDTTDNKTQISKLDELWDSVVDYRSSKHFYEVMKACARLRHLAPYNAMLVELQRPGAHYVLTAKQWRDQYHRVIKPNARPMLILVPFGPVGFVFDIGDTMTDPADTRLFKPSDDDILNRIAEPFKTRNDVPKKVLNNLLENLPIHGIHLDTKFDVGASFGAQIELGDDLGSIHMDIGSNGQVSWKASYLISVNKNASPGQSFASICHELGHLFCHHLPMPKDWNERKWEVRHLEHRWREFEAESVAWLVCERLGVEKTSEDYLASYLEDGMRQDTIHESVSIEQILKATYEVERTLAPMRYSEGLLYKHCRAFKDFCKEHKDKMGTLSYMK